MRKYRITLILLLMTIISCGQSLIDTNKTWSELEFGYMLQITGTRYYKFCDDTLIGGINYYKVFYSDDEFMTTWDHNDTYIREDSTKKVYMKYNDFSEELLYDFDVNTGDTINIEQIPIEAIVDTVYYENILGIDRKKIALNDGYGTQEIWYEGIGSLVGVLMSGMGVYPPVGGSTELLCAYDNSTLIYHNSTYSECYYVGIEDNGSNNFIGIYPNPATENITVECNGQDIQYIEIIDFLGRTVKTINDINEPRQTVSISDLKQGLFFVRVQCDGLVRTIKIVIQ